MIPGGRNDLNTVKLETFRSKDLLALLTNTPIVFLFVEAINLSTKARKRKKHYTWCCHHFKI
jgi:hypothetical protein